jgi:Holliday junction resolvasome RuvABC endonuclease subunit
MVAGVLVVAARASGARTLLVEPSTWKKQVIDHGNASKDEIAEWLTRQHPVLSGLTDGNQDAVDAACIGLYGQARLV